jgi:magnesium-protoporphyrin O-methyltransferase
MTTVKEHCCGANRFFDDKKADRQYRKYLKKGASRVTRGILSQFSEESVQNRSLIDVGGGIGAIQWWFLDNGGSSTCSVDSSEAYLTKTREHAEIHSWQEKTDFIFGDFVELEHNLAQADYVTLDKVICCYPDYKSIIEASCRNAKECIILSYPMDGFIASIISWLSDLALRLRSSDFKPYIHPVKEVRTTFKEQGFSLTSNQLFFPWLVEKYTREITD